jgi:multidrug efflux pump subunit AcrA (membrane-fusion protein)
VKIPAFLKTVVTVADPKTRTFEVTFGFTPTDEVNAIPGMTARVLVVWPAPKGEGNKILIPAQAIIPGKQEGQARVWVIDTGTMTAKGTDVTVGQLTGDEVEVQSGLAPGVSIAISGVQQLREGMKVRRYRLKDY